MENIDMEKINRWVIKSMTVVNYWKFTNEIFYFKDGKLFFIGTNGSGKSNLTQLFPFVLDGNDKRGRLDATANKEKREMDFYFKPRDSKGQIINGASGEYGYICLEFKKRYTEQYLTICIGQQYTLSKSSKNLKFNAFILKDGRRVGKDFSLYKKENGKVIPYTFKELEKILNLKKDCVFSDKKDYAEAINKELFGFNDIQDFYDLCNINVQMRNSQYTGKTKISEIKEKIMNFLPTLEDEKFENLSSSFQELEESKQILEDFQEDKNQISKLNNSYNEYNKALLYNKYEEYIKKENEYKDANEKLKEINETALKVKKEHEDITKEIETLEKNIISYKSQIALLNEAKEIKDNEEFERKLKSLQIELRNLCKELQEKESDASNKNNKITKLMNDINQIEDYKKTNKNQRGKLYKELSDQNIEIKFAGHLNSNDYQSIDSSIKTMKDKLSLSKKEALEYENDILDIAKLLKDYEGIKDKFSELEKKVQEIKEKIQGINLEIDRLENQKEQEKRDLIDKYYEVSESNKFLKISEDSLKEIERKIYSYDKFTEEEKEYIESIRENFYTKIWEEFKEEIGDLTLNLKEIDKDIKINNDELKNLKAQKQIVPTRTKEAILCRKELENRGIDYISLYEGLDFKENTDIKDSILLENQLINSDLLDSLVIPYSQQEEAKEVLKKYPCLMLTPSLKKNSSFDKFVLEDIDEEFKNVINDFLSSISIDETDRDSQYIIANNGYFRNGALEGYSIVSNQEDAKYIGLQRRKEKLKREIENKEKQILHLEVLKDELLQDKKIIENNIEELKEENRRFPKFKKITEILIKIKSYNDTLKNYNKDYKECKKDYDDIKPKFEKLNDEKTIKCKEKTFKATSDTYFKIHNKINIYIELLDKMIENVSNFENFKINQNNLEIQKLAMEEDIKSLTNKSKKLKNDIYEKEQKIKQIEVLIADKDIKRKLKELENYEIKLEKTLEKKEGKIKIQGKYESDITKVKEEVFNAEENLKEKEKIKKIFTGYLLSEINEKITYFSGKDEKRYKINSISELKPIFEEWEKDKDDFKGNLASLFNKAQTLAIDIGVKLKKWKLYQDIILLENTNFNDSVLNNRLVVYIELNNEGKDLLYNKIDLVISKIKSTESLIESQMENFLKTLISQEIGISLIEMIKETYEIIKHSSEQMEQMNTPVKVKMELELKDTYKKLKEILQKSISGNEDLMIPDKENLNKYILTAIEKMKEESRKRGESFSYELALKEIFDYRKWFNLKISHKKRGEEKFSEVKDKTVFSGGEKAMVIYLPMLSAMNFKYSKARPDAFKLMVLDEAFSVSDEKSRRSTIELIEDLDFDFVFNAPEMECLVPNTQFSIYTLKSSEDTGRVAISYSMWNGEKTIKKWFSENEIEELCK